MKSEFKAVKVGQPDYVWRKKGYPETGSTFANPTAKRKYVRILAICLAPMPANIIYFGVKHPLMRQVRDMCRAGLLERLQKDGVGKYYYKTTQKGLKVLSKAMSN